ncbi:MAG: hypothetical protein MPN21_21485 [Thermoanaerobaculia bacterium]|nr:hypothetical protein [Thermoanaerobaculia bacterium]
MGWKPRLDETVDLSELDLDAQEGFVLSRLDGSTSVEDLTFLTGLPEERISGILERLVLLGTVAQRAESKVAGASSREPDVEFDFDLEEIDLDGVGMSQEEFEVEVSVPVHDLQPAVAEGVDVEPAVVGVDPTVEESDEEDAAVRDNPGAAVDLGEEQGAEHDGNWRALFERELKPLEVDHRVEMARKAGDARLHAFCYDPSPRVISALLENQRFGLEHARRVAAHHRTGGGLDALGRRQQFVRDRQVQRNLFRNSATPQALLLRIFQAYRLAEIFRLTAGREATDRVRTVAKKQFRTKFPQSSAEERVQLILKTEGRCLPQLVGVALGGRAAALLCRRPLASTLLIRNLARWPSTPPPVLEHLMRQPAVRRSPVLKNEVLRHPNAPSRLQTS